MKFALVLLITMLFGACTTSAFARDTRQDFMCGGARARIDIIARDAPEWEDRVEAVVTVSMDGYSTVLRYRNIDFIGGQCVAGPGAAPLVVFQAYCGGSGCKDLDNWGIIESDKLRVLTVPRDDNRQEAQALAGAAALPRLDMVNIVAGPNARQAQ